MALSQSQKDAISKIAGGADILDRNGKRDIHRNQPESRSKEQKTHERTSVEEARNAGNKRGVEGRGP